MKKPQEGDALVLNYVLWVVKELFLASNVKWVRAENNKEENKYFTELEWMTLKKKK